MLGERSGQCRAARHLEDASVGLDPLGIERRQLVVDDEPPRAQGLEHRPLL